MASLTVVNVLYGYFNTKNNKLKWTGSLEDLKAFVLTEIDEETADNTTWRSSGGGRWNFESKQLTVTWLTKSENILFGGEKGNDLTDRVYTFLRRNEINAKNDNTANLKSSIESLLAEESEEESEDSPEESLDRINTLSKKDQGIANRGSDITLGAAYQHEKYEEDMSYEKSQNLHNSSSGKSLQSSQDNDLMQIIEAISDKVKNLATEVRQIKAINPQLNNQDLINDFREENRKLNSQNEQLQERNTDISCTMTDLHMKIKNLVNERDCLVTTLKILHLDRKDIEKQPATSGWRKEESKKESYDQVIHTEDVDLQTKRYKHGKTTRSDQAKSKPKDNANGNTEKSVKTTYIVGDSMIKHLDCHRLKRSVQNGNKRVHAETYRGTTTDAMQYHIKPCLQRKPDEIILHVGTNDLKEKNYIRHYIRNYIRHKNIGVNHLNTYGLHLNRLGTATLARNILLYLNSDRKHN
ncbi:Hypothetical predicted protein [Paramuricea clavata]|uniref:Uncharacterized protein n=1 Tax=Paramuricea clavata TaxID=317549 RepID=A0A6S7HDC9_PARCT|nr:Hypothetical predicted protein [Paramuricea clavata]